MQKVLAAISKTRLIGIIRLKQFDHPAEVAGALAAGGFQVLEFTLSGEGALQAISSARAALSPEIHIGAGTVMTPADVADAAAAGAEFIVTPVMKLNVIEACRRHNLPIVCGAFTPTEIVTAVESGAELVKLFPARLGGPQYVRDLLAPMPNLRLVPTGGVSAGNARDYLEAGAAAVGIGGSILPADLVANRQYAEITARAQSCVQAVR